MTTRARRTPKPSAARSAAAPARHGSAPTVRERLVNGGLALSKSELKVARELLANYPAAGLATVSRLARQAGVSDPTVLRFANRLGYEGYGALQDALLGEVETHMRSPLTILPARGRAAGEAANAYQAFFASTLAQLEAVRRETAAEDLDAAVALLANPKAHVICLGGRFSRFLAGILQRCLQHLRPGTELAEGTAADLVDRLADVSRRDVLAVFDYRRYQSDIVRFAEQAAARGARVVLFTDRWKSPIARVAEVTLTVPIETASPFDTMVTALAQTEAVVAGLTVALGEAWRERTEAIERVRTENGVTLERNGAAAGPASRRRAAGQRRTRR